LGAFWCFFPCFFAIDFWMNFRLHVLQILDQNGLHFHSRTLSFFVTFPFLFPRGCFRRSLGSPWHPFGSIRVVLCTLFGSIFDKCCIKSSLSAPESAKHLQVTARDTLVERSWTAAHNKLCTPRSRGTSVE
jgi:hypothetical protein